MLSPHRPGRPNSLASITSEVTKGIYEHGRRYHSYGSSEYAFPNDEPEAERLDMQHAMQILLLSDKLFLSPIGDSPQKVLDLGTGTGIWAIDFADAYPSAQVIGTDLSAIQPDWIPPNCRFEIDDAELDWTYDANSFDFIHNRNFICSIRDWPRLIRQCFRALKPGGWLEWQEKHPLFLSDDGSLDENSPMAMWAKLSFEAGEIFGKSLRSPQFLKGWMEDAGFVDVQQHILKVPIGHWPKDPRLKNIGLFESVNIQEGIENITLRLFTHALQWSAEEVQLFMMDVRKQTRSNTAHSYYTYYVVFGRKPEDPPSL